MKHIRKAIVIGGGIAGPVTAMALQKAGIEATVYEAYASTADGVGGMLGLAPNGFDALAAIDLDGPVRRVAAPVSAMVLHSWTGKPLARFDGSSGRLPDIPDYSALVAGPQTSTSPRPKRATTWSSVSGRSSATR